MGTELTKARKPVVPKARRETPTTDAPSRAMPSSEATSNAITARAPRSLVDQARESVAEANARLPYFDTIQAAFGDHDLATVRVVIGGEAAAFAVAIGANAFTVGEHVGFRSAPDLHLATHEAAHVVHQRSGVALGDGVGRPGDAYEQHANAIADAVVAGRSVHHLLGPVQARTEAPALQMECGCGACPTCVSRPWQPTVQFAGMGDVHAAEQRMEDEARKDAEADANAGKKAGLTRDELEAKFYRLAEMYSDWGFWRECGPRDLGDWMDTYGVPDGSGDVWAFNTWVMSNQEKMHPVPLKEMMNVGATKLTADKYMAYEGARVELLMDAPLVYVTRAHKFWASKIFSQYYLRHEWHDRTFGKESSFYPDAFNDWKSYMNLGTKGEHRISVEIKVGGSSSSTYSVWYFLDNPIVSVNHDEFEAEFLKKTATEADLEGNPSMFTLGSDGTYHVRPDAKPTTLEEQTVTILVKLGALKAWHDQKKISDEDYKKAKEYFEERNKVLEAITPASKELYVMTGAFVGSDMPQAVPIRAVMWNNLPSSGSTFQVTLKDTTLDPKVATTHEGTATRPKAGNYDTKDWVEMERVALLDMADHWKANNDYPMGTVTLYVGSRVAPGWTITVTIPQNNWKKSLKKFFGGLAMLAAVGAMVFGQAEIAVPLMIVGAAATLASVALGIEHRIKMGTFGWDRELLLDVLTVVTTFMGLGALSSTFKAFSVAGKIFYLVGMASMDVVQGVLIAVETKQQLEEARIEYHGKLVLATSDEERARLKKEYQETVSSIIGGAIVSGGFIAVSVAGGIKGAREVRVKAGGHPEAPGRVGEEVKPDAEPIGRAAAEPHVEAENKAAEFENWKSRLDEKTQAKLETDPAFRKTYEEMDPDVRRALTLCESPCIPDDPKPTAQDIAKIKDAMNRLGIPAEDFRLREYLHRNRGPKMKSAVEELGKCTNETELTALYDRSISAHATGGKAVKGPDGKWSITTPDGVTVNEHAIAKHGELIKEGTKGFFESHHGIQDAWAIEAGLEPFGYARNECPAINLRDRHAGSPHQRITAAQKGRESGRSGRTYENERLNLGKDMVRADVPEGTAQALLAKSDEYFATIYRNVETQMAADGKSRPEINAALSKFFGTWKPK